MRAHAIRIENKNTNRNDDDDDRCEIEYLYWVICHKMKLYNSRGSGHSSPLIHSFIYSNEMIASSVVV